MPHNSASAPTYLPLDYLGTFTAQYNAYQAKFTDRPPERDLALMAILSTILARTRPDLSVLDVGCSTGNLLVSLRRAFPVLTLAGGDLATSAVDACRQHPELAGVDVQVCDLLHLPPTASYDVIIANAVAVYFPDALYAQALRSVAGALKPGGYYLAFEWIHPFDQDLTITETSASHPLGLEIHFRPYRVVQAHAAQAGFRRIEFRPFEIPIDLPKVQRTGFESLTTYTERLSDGSRLQFRGALAQPWCHLIAQT